MKRTLLMAFVAILAINAFAQDPELRKGYIGIAIGPAFPTGDIDNDAVSGGLQLNLVNFGYLFSDHVGMAATWFGTAFTSKIDNNNSIGLGGLLVGPLFSTASKSYKTEFDFKPMIGFARGTLLNNGSSSSSAATFALGLSGTARWNCGRRISVSGGLDYYYGKPENFNLSSLAIMFGINYRLK